MSKHYNVELSTYKESEALQQLIEAINSTMDDKRFQTNELDVMKEQFTINVGGVQTAFYLGGPQMDALFAFVAHIADENFYSVDFDKGIVQGW